jgi:hypothetical protein
VRPLQYGGRATPGGATGPLLWAGLRGNSATFDLFKINSNTFELNQSEDGLPVLKFFLNKIWLCRELNNE